MTPYSLLGCRWFAISAAEFAIGYVIASLLGIVMGFVMASSELGKKILQPWISGLYATPTIALAPLFILWFGIGIWSKVLVVIFKRTAEFVTYVDRIWRLIEDDVRASVIEEHA